MRAVWLAMVMVFTGCSGEPSYVGLRCRPTEGCPGDLVCGPDQRCVERGSFDAGPNLDAGEIDVGPSDTGGLDVGTIDQGVTDADTDAGSNSDSGFSDATPEDTGPADTGPPDSGPMVTQIEITPSAVDVPAGFDVQLTAMATFSDQSTADVTSGVAWSVADPSIADVDGGGFLRTQLPGTTIINALLDGVSGAAALNVSDPVITEHSAWNKHVLVVKSDGSVWGWGWNENGQVSASASTHITAPTALPITDVVWVRTGGIMSVAVKEDGTVWSWGSNLGGELGQGAVGANNNPVPGQVVDDLGNALTGVTDIRCGYSYCLALLATQQVRVWGSNAFGNLGLGTPPSTAQPSATLIPTLSGVTTIAAGMSHGVVILSNGNVWTWGYNEYGQLGNGTTLMDRNTPDLVVTDPLGTPLANVVAIDAGWGHTIAMHSNGTVSTWGWNVRGHLGDGTQIDRSYPVTVLDGSGPLTGATAIDAGFTFNGVLKTDGTLWAFGSNIFGQVGDGSTEMIRTNPVLVTVSPGGAAFTGVRSFDFAGDTGTALTTADELWVWGSNENGELANGAFGGGGLTRSPILVQGL